MWYFLFLYLKVVDDEALALAVQTLQKRQEQGADLSTEAGNAPMHDDDVRFVR